MISSLLRLWLFHLHQLYYTYQTFPWLNGRLYPWLLCHEPRLGILLAVGTLTGVDASNYLTPILQELDTLNKRCSLHLVYPHLLFSDCFPFV